MQLAVAQVPQRINYQAAVRNTAGEVIKNQNVSFRISILNGSPTGNPVFSETHNTTTNAYGIVNLVIGSGAPVLSTLEGVDWKSGNMFFKIELDVTGGSNFLEIGVSQVLSVPYAIWAEYVVNDKVDDADADPINEIQDLQFDGKILRITNNSNATAIDFTAFLNTDSQAISYDLITHILSIENGGSVDLSDLVNAAPQQLSYDTLSYVITLENGGSIDLSKLAIDSDNQTLSVTDNQLSISGGNMVDLPVPQSNFSVMTTDEFRNLSDPRVGQMVNLSDADDDEALYLFNGNKWLQISANYFSSNKYLNAAGANIYACEDTIQLNAYLPESFTGVWGLDSYDDGILMNRADPKTKFIIQEKNYSVTLDWDISGFVDGKIVNESDQLNIKYLPKNGYPSLEQCYVVESKDWFKFSYDFNPVDDENENGGLILLDGVNGGIDQTTLYGSYGEFYKVMYKYWNTCGDNYSDTTEVYFTSQTHVFRDRGFGFTAKIGGVPLTDGVNGVWSQFSGPGTSVISSSNSDTTVITVDTPGRYLYRWSRTGNSGCTIYDTYSVDFYGNDSIWFGKFIGNAKSSYAQEYDEVWNNIIIYGAVGSSKYMKGIAGSEVSVLINVDPAAGTITIPKGQRIGDVYGEGVIGLYNSLDINANIIGTFDSTNGTIRFQNFGMVIVTGQYQDEWWDAYDVTLTKTAVSSSIAQKSTYKIKQKFLEK